MSRATSFLPSSVALLVAWTTSVALVLGLPAVAAGADTPASPPPTAAAPVAPDPQPSNPERSTIDASGVLDRAASALSAPADATDDATDEPRTEVTLALRDLFAARRSLDPQQAARAEALLARPTDGARDTYGDGYVAAETSSCSAHFCVHWVRTGADAPPDDAWARKTRTVMEQVWKNHIGTLGYRKPVTDGSRGGNAKFDVYLAELGSRGIYGYCAPESTVRGQRKQASGFCVLDNDFAASQFGRPPKESLRVTAAHEFFHAIQFAYDYTEDKWLIESTATWIEERFADAVNDNRAYLTFGQAARSASSLDLFDPSGLAHYGNWVFWEFLSERFGNDIVRQVIQRTGTGGGLPDDYSTQALTKVLDGEDGGGFARLYATFAAANTQPALSYEEGTAFPGVAPVKSAALSPRSPRARFSTRVNHLAAKTVQVTPRSLGSKKWRLTVTVATGTTSSAPAVSVLALGTDGTLKQRSIDLSQQGQGSLRLRFDARRVRSVSVTLANASTRYSCGAGSGFACAGRPLEQRERFSVDAEVSRR